MNKVVKCKNDKCGQYFMHTEKNTKCPFCYTEYGEVEEKPSDLPEQAGKKAAAKTKREFFKIKIRKNS